MMNGKPWSELTEAEHQKFPGDFEAQVGQGPITLHSDEHLATSDQGVAMTRRLLQRQLDAIAAGRDPAGVSFDRRAAGGVRGRQLHHGKSDQKVAEVLNA